MTNKNLNEAKKAKNDEFYTSMEDIEKELIHYTKHFKTKVVYCNCDNPTWSNFWRYFYRHFSHLGLKKLISTHYELDGSSYAAVYEGGHDNAENFAEGVTKVPLKGNGDFRSDECIEYLKQADVVVTNPPFSLARAYVAELKKYDKKFIIIGDLNWITYKEIFPLIEENKLWLGYTKVKEFKQPDGTYKKFGNKLWFTNVNIKKRYHKLETAYRWHKHKEKYPDLYPKYDNYDAIEVSKVSQIPLDYDDIMGVPITFLDTFNPDQFEIIKFRKGNDNKDLRYTVNNKLKYPYKRIFIRNKYPEKYQNDL